MAAAPFTPEVQADITERNQRIIGKIKETSFDARGDMITKSVAKHLEVPELIATIRYLLDVIQADKN